MIQFLLAKREAPANTAGAPRLPDLNGPLLKFGGEKDYSTPPSLVRVSYKNGLFASTDGFRSSPLHFTVN